MITFKFIKTTYVQKGVIQLRKTYAEGHVHVQGAENIVGEAALADRKALPEYFVNGWAQFMFPVPDKTKLDADANFLYDKGAYQVGQVYDTEYLNIPKFYKAHLFYFVNTKVTNDTKELVTFDPGNFVPYEGTKADGTQGVVDAEEFVNILKNKVWFSDEEYYNWLHEIPHAMEGYNRNGKMYPPAVTKTAVSDLLAVKGKVSFVNDNGVVTEGVITINVAPMYVQNEKPLFDMVYIATDVLVDTEAGDGSNAATTSLHPGRFLRWYGGTPSATRAAINWTDDSQEGVSISQGAGLDGVDNPRIPDPFEIDGVSYNESGAYNVTRKPNWS